VLRSRQSRRIAAVRDQSGQWIDVTSEGPGLSPTMWASWNERKTPAVSFEVRGGRRGAREAIFKPVVGVDKLGRKIPYEAPLRSVPSSWADRSDPKPQLHGASAKELIPPGTR
jgi:hypothetical protein